MTAHEAALEWQTGVWNRISDTYRRQIDSRFEPVVDGCVRRAGLAVGETVLDLGTGTGAVAVRAAGLVGPTGSVLAVDISPEMLAIARRRAAELGLAAIDVREGRAEQLPVERGAVDVVVASLSLMYAIDRAAAAREIARVLRPGGRIVAAVWAGPDDADIVRFQQTAGTFAPPPPVPGVGPGALADAAPFIAQLEAAGIGAHVETELTGFEFPCFEQAWDVLAGVTTAQLDEERRAAAQRAVQDAMWPDPAAPRRFRNRTQFVLGSRRNSPEPDASSWG